MKIQLDTEAKTVTIEETVSLNEFINFIKNILPNSWKQYYLKVSVINNWAYPIVIEKGNWPTPYWECPSGDAAITTYNLEYK